MNQLRPSSSARPKVAYFCMEYGLHEDLTIYSGGLGILAGDYMKSVAELGLPVIGIGLLWDHGYTCQRINDQGQPVDFYPLTCRDALEPVAVELAVSVGGRMVPCDVYRVRQYVESPLYLLEPSRAEDRWITARLYGGGEEDRLAQEILLGVGGVRLLHALGQDIDVYHFNEGHAVFAGLELLRVEISRGKSAKAALRQVRQQIVFTTHTPVLAGNETHPIELMKRMGATLDLDDSVIEQLGGRPFSMTVAGLRLARRANAVAELHGHTARKMWSGVTEAAPIIAITNGVHRDTWQDPAMRAAMGETDPGKRRRRLWLAHEQLKSELLDEIARRTSQVLRQDCPLVGFARRAAPYKRADLIFSDPDRIQRLFDATGLQLVFAGKAHPADQRGKALVAKLVAAARRYPDHVVFLENYDMKLGRLLTRSCDVWLNNPRWPMEASGTSGMKAAMNGVLNVSILDGWWPEGCRNGETGWQIGAPPVPDVGVAAQDVVDREALYRTLEERVLPRYATRMETSAPGNWVGMMEQSILMSQDRFSAARMVEEYYRVLYA